MTRKEMKVVLVSGGMGGVASAAADLFVRKGYRIALLYRNSTEEHVSERKRELGEHSFFVHGDMLDPKQIQNAVQAVLVHYGRIDVCVHAAVGAITRKPVLDMTNAEFRREFDVGLFGAHALFSAVAPHMKARHTGTLIGVTSAVIEGKGAARMGAYSTAKYALRGLLRELHRELSVEGISVYGVAPDLLKTALTADLPDKYFEFAQAGSPHQKLMTPREVAQALLRVAEGEVPSGSSLLVSTGEAAPL